MNILAIGNSFSNDATRYLYQIARADGFDLTIVNLLIGGCPLSKHYKNMLSDAKEYWLEVNGSSTGFHMNIKEALLSRDWDVVTFQQVSRKSVDYESFQPYLKELSEYTKKCAPEAEQIIHQTWAYEQGSQRLCEELGYTDHKDMFRDIECAYQKAADSISAKRIIRSGELFQMLIDNGIQKVHRDTFHAKFGIGRYALALLWYSVLSGNDVSENTFRDFDEPVTEEEVKIAKECVKAIRKQ